MAVVHPQTINNYYFSRSGNCLLDKIAQFPWPCTCKVSMIGRVLNLQDSRIVAIDWAFWLLICYLSALCECGVFNTCQSQSIIDKKIELLSTQVDVGYKSFQSRTAIAGNSNPLPANNIEHRPSINRLGSELKMK